MTVEDERVSAVALLRDLGLNQLEAEVYAFLLPHEPTTAYGIGKALGRPTANVYKAIERLGRFGAVLVEEGAARVCRAVPAREFIAHVQRRFLEQTRAAEKALHVLERDTFDERVYRVSSVDEVLQKAHEMLQRATRVAVVDAFPKALDRLTPAIEEAARRGVEVFVEAYRPTRIEGADVVVVPDGQLSLEAWRCEQLNLVVDGREHVLALLSEDLGKVFQAVWSSSIYLSCLHHAGRMSEITLIRLMDRGEVVDAALLDTLRQHRFFRNSEVPGHRELVRRFAARAKQPSADDEKEV